VARGHFRQRGHAALLNGCVKGGAVDSERFDRLTRLLAQGLSRRAAVVGLAALSGLGLAQHETAVARKKRKKKKKRKKGAASPPPPPPRQPPPPSPPATNSLPTPISPPSCNGVQCLPACEESFTKVGTLWTLQADCVTTETIVIDDEVTLEGANKTIHLAGPVSGYQLVSPGGTEVHAGLLVENGSGSVRNLTLDQGALDCQGSQKQSAIVMLDASGSIESVTIDITSGTGVVACYRGIDAAATQINKVVDLTDVTVSGPRRNGIIFSGPVVGTIEESTVEECLFGIEVSQARLTIDGNSITATTAGINVASGFPDNADVTVQSNTITGTSGSTNHHGIIFQSSPKAFVSGNTISNFNCGITIGVDVSDQKVTIANDNTFLPPPNGTDICDQRP
jgi:hypothetical protein